jgi:hypothetical protein
MAGLLPFPLLLGLAVGIPLPPLLPQPESTMAVWCMIAALCLRKTILLWWRTTLALTATEYVLTLTDFYPVQATRSRSSSSRTDGLWRFSFR